MISNRALPSQQALTVAHRPGAALSVRVTAVVEMRSCTAWPGVMARLTSREKRALGDEVRCRQVAGKLEHAMLALGRPHYLRSAGSKDRRSSALSSLPISPCPPPGARWTAQPEGAAAHCQCRAGPPRRILRCLLLQLPWCVNSSRLCITSELHLSDTATALLNLLPVGSGAVGVDVRLQYATGQDLPQSVQACLLGLLEVPTPKPMNSNMQRYHGAAWLAEAKLKQAQLVEDGAKYILIIPNVKAISASGTTAPGVHRNSHDRARSPPADDPTEPQGFVQFRFVEEEGVPVLYVYELQLGHPLQRCGLGSFLMRLMEGVAHESSMVGVMLTVQTKNTGALDFYLRKLNYEISPISPSKVTSEASNSKYDYVILQKISDATAKEFLEARGQACLAASEDHSGRGTERLSQL
eukprot:SM000177S03178  [mRNA]  locus=s177:47216:49541:- [translate_table: standard]